MRRLLYTDEPNVRSAYDKDAGKLLSCFGVLLVVAVIIVIVVLVSV